MMSSSCWAKAGPAKAIRNAQITNAGILLICFSLMKNSDAEKPPKHPDVLPKYRSWRQAASLRLARVFEKKGNRKNIAEINLNRKFYFNDFF
jgi:hypothetical protein